MKRHGSDQEQFKPVTRPSVGQLFFFFAHAVVDSGVSRHLSSTQQLATEEFFHKRSLKRRTHSRKRSCKNATESHKRENRTNPRDKPRRTRMEGTGKEYPPDVQCKNCVFCTIRNHSNMSRKELGGNIPRKSPARKHRNAAQNFRVNSGERHGKHQRIALPGIFFRSLR